MEEDQVANFFGRLAPSFDNFQNCETTCSFFVSESHRHKFIKNSELRGRFSFPEPGLRERFTF